MQFQLPMFVSNLIKIVFCAVCHLIARPIPQLPLSALVLAEFAARARLNLVVDAIDGRARSPAQLHLDREARFAFTRSPRWHDEFASHVRRRAWHRRRAWVCVRGRMNEMHETSMLLLAEALARSALEDDDDDDRSVEEEAAPSAGLADHCAALDAGNRDTIPASLEPARSASAGVFVSTSTAALAISSFLADAPTDVFRAVISFI